MCCMVRARGEREDLLADRCPLGGGSAPRSAAVCGRSPECRSAWSHGVRSAFLCKAAESGEAASVPGWLCLGRTVSARMSSSVTTVTSGALGAWASRGAATTIQGATHPLTTMVAFGGGTWARARAKCEAVGGSQPMW